MVSGKNNVIISNAMRAGISQVRKTLNAGLIFLLLFAIASTSFANPTYLDSFPGVLRGWVPLALLATFTVLILHGLIYGIAHGFAQNELGVYAKAEILQAVATFFIISFLGVIISSLTAYVPNVVHGKVACGGDSIQVNDIKSSLEVVKCRLSEKAEKLSEIEQAAYDAAKGVSVKLSIMATVFGIPVFQGNWVNAWYKEFENYRVIYDVATSLLISLNAQIKFVDYVNNNMLTFFLPLGIILRSFYFTRGIGAFFISIAFGLYFIFPILFSLTDPGFISTPLPPPSELKIPNLCYPSFSGVTSIIETVAAGPSSSGFGLDIKNAGAEISKIYIGLILHPFVVLGITLIFVRYMMYIFGGDPYDLMRYVGKMV